ncbi:hypothetical protein [Roseomonas sp. WA12]
MPTTQRRALALTAFAAFSAFPLPSWAQDVAERATALNGQHPAAYYEAAAELFRAGKRDDATFFFYLGQLRYRVHLAARPNNLVDGDRALFSSLNESFGRPMNEWAFGDIPTLLRTIDAVLAYDARTPDQFTPPTTFPGPTRDIRAGLSSMRDDVARRAAEIRRDRSSNGLPNR